MRIVDQQAKFSVDMDRVIIVRVDEAIMCESVFRENSWVLGKYGTADRAEEIFEQMHKAYATDIDNSLRYFDDDDLNDISKELGTNSILTNDVRCESLLTTVDSRNDIYYMPKE